VAQVFWQSADAWTMLPLEADCYSVAAAQGDDGAAGRAVVVAQNAAPPEAPWPRLVLRPAAAGKPQWLCLASSDDCLLRVNGDPVIGFRILAHRDVVEVAGARVFFSAEATAHVETYHGPPGKRCPRCMLELQADDPVVRCPGCGTMHHLRPERKCWIYGPKCTVCSQATAMDGGLTWSPEEL
jgi:Prokaryotic RING finger family 1